jgi:hypothetical protein
MSNGRIDLEHLEEDALLQDLNWSIARFEGIETLVKEMLAELKKMYEREDALVGAIKELCDSEDSTGCSGDLTVVSLDPMLKLYELTSE